MPAAPDPSLVMSAFKSQFKQFLDDLVLVFPSDVDVRTGANALYLLLKANPLKLIQVWKNRVVPYSTRIDGGEINYFLTKEYDQDIDMAEKSSVLDVIERLRAPVRNLGPENKAKAMKYMQNLTNLTTLYYQQVSV